MSAEDDEKKRKGREEKQRQDDLRNQIDVNQVWDRVDFNEEKTEPVIDDRPGWKTVRIFVSSTFKDFHQEREVLVKEVFADLRAWCEERKLHLIDCDLRWGVPKETTSEVTLKTCLEEIDRCYENNKVPYFVNMTCKRVGWIPLDEELPPKLLSKYRLEFGFSVTEMEIVHAAYRIENPNALFLLRDDSFLEEIDDEDVKKEFIDELQPKAEEKLVVLRDKIKSRFADRVVTYKCNYIKGERLYTDYTGEKGRPKLKLDENFSKTVLNFFKERIERQYPLVTREVEHYEEAKYRHEAFMTNRSEMVLGREDILQNIADYIIAGDSERYPRLIVGEAGAGKSSIIAKAVSETLAKINHNKLPCKGSSGSGWKVFYHFVGAVPNSTSLREILVRLLNELKPEEELPETLEELVEVVKRELAADFQMPILIFIDALNQIDKENHVEPTFWLPEKLSQNVRCVLSLISDSDAYKALKRRKDLPSSAEMHVPGLEASIKMEIVNMYLGQFNKTLEMKQMVILTAKASSKNPLWLNIACEELRIFGDFNTVTAFINKLSDSLPGLLMQVLERFEREAEPVLLISTLCLLEVSKFGLLESELLEILADKEYLEYRDNNREEMPESRVTEKGRRLPPIEWAGVYRKLRVYLRPFGNPGEGRLDFYHRSLSKVVREKYLLEGRDTQESSNRFWWWHKKLADFYSKSGTYDRKVEEYPYHLLKLKQYAKDEEEKNRYCRQLEKFLLDYAVFKRLFDHEFSGALLYYWRECGDKTYDKMTDGYMSSLKSELTYYVKIPEVLAEKYEDYSRLFSQAGKYSKSLEYAEDCRKLLEDMESSDKDEKLMYIYGHIAHIKSLLLPPTQSASEIPELESIIELHEKAINIIRDRNLDQKDKKYKKYLALQFIKTAYARGGIASRCDAFSLSRLLTKKALKKEMTAKGLDEVEKAIKLYREIKDFGHELEAQLTKATLHRGNKDKQLEIYRETKQRCEELVGVQCPLMCRLCFNMGVVHGQANENESAFDYYNQAYNIALEIYGPDHVKTEKYKMQQQKYKRVAKKRQEDSK